MTFSPRRRPAVCAVALLLATTACGTRVPHDQVVAAWSGGGGAAINDQSGQPADGAAEGPIGAAETAPDQTTPASADAAGRPAAGPGSTVAGSSTAAGPEGAAGTGRAPATAACAATGTIKVGNVAPYSATAVGPSYRPFGDALQVWQADVNARGGICGRKVQVIQRDDKGSTSENAAQVKDLVENQGVVAFVAQGAALTLAGSKDYLERKQVAVIGGDMLTTDWTNSPALFPVGLPVQELTYAALLSSLPYTKGNKKMALLYCAEAQACADGKDLVVEKGIAKKAGVEVVYSKQTSLTAISFASECQAAKDAGAATMVLSGDASFIERVANSCGQQGLAFEYTALVGASNSQARNQYLNGHFHVATQVFPWTASSTAGHKRYNAAIERYYPQIDNSGASALAWVSGLVFEQVLRQLGSGAATPASVWNAAHTKVKGFDAEGLTSPLTYVPGKQAAPRCAGFTDVSGGRWVARGGGALTCRQGAPLL